MMGVDKLEGRELDAAVAQMLGWEDVHRDPESKCHDWIGRMPGVDYNSAYRRDDSTHRKIQCNGKRLDVWDLKPWQWSSVHRFSSYIAPAMDLLRNLMETGALVRFCNGDGDSFDIDTGSIHLSVGTWEEVPTMISRAFLKAKEVDNGRL